MQPASGAAAGGAGRLRPALATPRGLLYVADCLVLLGALRDGSVDCVFADPPFNLGKRYGPGVSDDRAREDYLAWSRAWLDEAVRVLKPGGTIFVYILPRWGYHLAAHLEARGLSFRHWIALSSKGSFPRGRKLYPAHYALLYFTRGEPRRFTRPRLPVPTCRHCGGDIKDYGGHRKFLHPAGISLTDLWEDTAPARHGSVKARWGINELKPMIPERCLRIATRRGDVVLDPFGGGGSTFETAERLGRYWLGSEITTAEPVRRRFARAFPGLAGGPPLRLARLFRRPAADFALLPPAGAAGAGAGPPARAQRAPATRWSTAASAERTQSAIPTPR
jgi:site-specific DNA-methyltransferase (adenine-specific)